MTKKLEWTRVPPTEPGWYWVKWDSSGAMPPEIARMDANPSGEPRFNRWWFVGSEWEHYQFEFEFDRYEFWPERLTPPEEARGAGLDPEDRAEAEKLASSLNLDGSRVCCGGEPLDCYVNSGHELRRVIAFLRKVSIGSPRGGA